MKGKIYRFTYGLRCYVIVYKCKDGDKKIIIEETDMTEFMDDINKDYKVKAI